MREALSFLVAVYVWWFAFSSPVDFWYRIYFAGAVLLSIALSEDMVLRYFEPSIRDGVIGIISGVIFYLLVVLSIRLLPLSPLISGVEVLESFRDLAPAYVYAPVTLAVAVVEELFWRGFMLLRLYRKIGNLGIPLAILLYAMGHVSTGMTVLLVGALVAGIYWTLLLLWRRNLLTPVISHLTWDALLLVWGV